MPDTYPTFSATIVFVNKDDAVISVDDWEPSDFFSAWSNGDLKRSIKIVDGDSDLKRTVILKLVREAYQEGMQSSAMNWLTLMVKNCFDDLENQLFLSKKLLTFIEIKPGCSAVISVPEDEETCRYEVQKKVLELAIKKKKVFIPSIPNESSSVFSLSDWDEDPVETLEKVLHQVILEIVVNSNKQTFKAKQFTPMVFIKNRNQLFEYRLPAPAMLISPHVAVQMIEDSDSDQWMIVKKDLWPSGNLGRYADLDIFCDGGPNDPYSFGLKSSDFFVVTSPPHLGVHTEAMPIMMENVDRRIIGQAAIGWFFFSLRGKLLFGRGVGYAEIENAQ